MNGFQWKILRFKKLQPLINFKKVPNKHDPYHSIRHKDCKGKGLDGGKMSQRKEATEVRCDSPSAQLFLKLLSVCLHCLALELGALPATNIIHIHLWLGFCSLQGRWLRSA